MDASPASAPPAVDPALGQDDAHDEAATVAPKKLSEQELADGLKQLRTDFRTAAIAHFSVLFLHHLGGTFNTDHFELDLLGVKPGAQVPALLGKILNTLANDRNCNSSNWLNALRRSYNRRVTDRSDNPFYSWHRVPGSVVEAERAQEREREAAEYDAQLVASVDEKKPAPESDKYGIFAAEEQRLRDAEKALYRSSSKYKSKMRNTAATSGSEDVAPSEAAAQDPVTKEALDDGFNADMADVIAEDAAAASTTDAVDVKDEPVKEEDPEEEWYEEQRAVEWEDLSLKTKLEAIYNVCEWHMVDPERQFRKYLQWDGEAAWRLDPIGKDSKGNTYYHTADDRLWMQRPVPEANAAQPAGQPIRRPRTLLGLRAGPRDKSKKGTITGVMRFKLRKNAKTGDYEQVDEGGVESGDEAEVEEAPRPVDADRGELEEWEREYWEERLRAETTPGFVEWEAVCINLDDWRAFAERFADSDDAEEQKLRDLINDEVIPTIEEEQSRRRAELAEQERKRLTRAQTRESQAEEENRLAAERIAAAERGTRSARHVKSYAETAPDTVDAMASAAASKAPPSGESREERLRKREEEKRRHEEELERQQLEELREREREEARQKNGGVLPVELMTDEERAAHELALEQERKRADEERKRVEAEEKKKQREEAKRARARERRAEQKAAAAAEKARAAAAPPPVVAAVVDNGADEAWYLDCEICGLAGWNYDDGQGLICCDQCEDWQHLPCHIYADEIAGRAPQPYSDEDFKWICGHCRGTCHRRPRPPKPAPGAPPTIAYAQVGLPDPSAARAGQKRKPSEAASSSAAAAAKKPKPKANGQPPAAAYGQAGHPLYHPSAYAPASAPPAAAAPAPVAQPQPQPQSQPQQQQASMSYEQLKAAVEANPALMQQLPPEYQAHFSQLLGLPLPPA